MRYQPEHNKARRGIVAILVAVALLALLGIVAIALDGGVLQDSKRRVQGAADAAALAAATVFYENYTKLSVSNPDPGGQAAAAAQQRAANNGFPNNGTTNTVVVNIPPTSGPFTGKIDYAEVIITYKQPRYFSAIWGSTPLPVVARAVARGAWAGSGDGVIVLDPTVKSSLNASGGGTVSVTGGASFIVDSNDAGAGSVTGGGSITANDFEITGGTVGPFNGTVNTGVPPYLRSGPRNTTNRPDKDLCRWPVDRHPCRSLAVLPLPG
jgi:hypothetical protein